MRGIYTCSDDASAFSGNVLASAQAVFTVIGLTELRLAKLVKDQKSATEMEDVRLYLQYEMMSKEWLA